MNKSLRYDISEHPLIYKGKKLEDRFKCDRVAEFNHRHAEVLSNYDLELIDGAIITLDDRFNNKSNFGALRNRQVRQSVIVAASLSAVAVALHGRGALNRIPKESVTKELVDELKRSNDRTSAQIMAEVFQTTTETLPAGEEVLIESTITEGVRVKPGKEAGGNPTIAVGTLFGKDEHRARYGLPMPRPVTLLSMGNDVIDGTTKSIKGHHSSLTALFLTESNVKRHLPDIYVQRWMAGAHFEEFNPRSVSIVDAAEIIAKAYGFNSLEKLSAFFLDRPRHHIAMEALNKANVATPFDKDGDLFPAIILGSEGLSFPNGRGLNAMIGEIGGSAEWVTGVLPLVWRGGQAIGMLTSQSVLTRKDISAEEVWKERFHFTEEEYMLIQDARFEQKPYFTVGDILDDPFAGGIAAYGCITDNLFLPFMRGVEIDEGNGTIESNVLVVTSIGFMTWWNLKFKCKSGVSKTRVLMQSPKDALVKLKGAELEKAIGRAHDDPDTFKRFRWFFINEYYPALIPVRDKFVLLHKAVQGLIDRGALTEKDREIIAVTEKLANNIFVDSGY
jgi:fructose-1,6-bisphosphatase/sedoheptulose 1,7-bisphosphatase-like protein